MRVANSTLSVFVFCILRGLFFFYVSSSFFGGVGTLDRTHEVEREPQKLRSRCIDRSIRETFRRFFAMRKEEAESIDRRRRSHTRRRGLILPVAWSFLEWSDAISLSLSLSPLIKR